MKADREKFLTIEEFQKLLNMIDDDKDYLLFYLIGNLGLRAGESVRLRLCDFDCKRGVVNIPTLKRIEDQRGYRIKRGELPKTYFEIPFLKDGEDLVLRHSQAYNIKPRGWIFPSGKDGFHISERTVRNKFKEYAKKAELNPVYSCHSLRHMKATALYESTGSHPHVRDFLRHSSGINTHVYIHASEEAQRRIMKNVARKLGILGLKPRSSQ